MDFIPTFHFVASLVLFGLLMYLFKPIIQYLSELMGITSSTNMYAGAMFFLWAILAGVNLFGSGIRLIMAMQERRG